MQVTDDEFARTDRAALAADWELTVAELPEAIRYLMARLKEVAGELELVEAQLGESGARYRYRALDRQAYLRYVEVTRPRGWSAGHEIRALHTLRAALARLQTDEELDLAA